MLLQQQKQSCNSKWWHFNTHSLVSVLALEKCDVSQSIPVPTICFCAILRFVLGRIAFALFSSLFFRPSLGSSRRKCSNKKSLAFSPCPQSMVQMVAITAFEVNYHVDNFLQKWTRLPCNCSLSTKVSQMSGESEKNAIDFRRFSAMSSWNERREGGGKSQC